MLLVWHPPRYAYPVMVPILSSLPIVLVLVLEKLPIPRLLGSLVALLPLALLWPARLPTGDPMTWDFPPSRVPLVTEVQKSVAAEDHYMDCARLDTGLLWAPDSRMPASISTFLPSQNDLSELHCSWNGLGADKRE